MQNEPKNKSLIKEVFTIPNILVYIRILLIPVFIFFYLHKKYEITLVVLIVSFLTDFFDGKIARHFNQVTDLGKTLDPIADKLYQFSVALCLMFEYPLLVTVAAILFVKEISMGIMGLILLSKGGEIFGAKWYGKISTAFVDLTMVFLFLVPVVPYLKANISKTTVDILVIACDVMLLTASVLYTRLFSKKIKELN